MDLDNQNSLPVASGASRRGFLKALAVAGGAVTASGLVASTAARAQQQVSPAATPRDWSGQNPLPYPDPDIIALDNRFRRYIIFNTPIQRLYTGTLWAEGPAWNGQGHYLVWSDIPNNVQMRWLEEDGRVTVFRNPSGYSNGNTFDYEGRQLSCEHGGRRVVRYEHSGSVTVVAERFEGKRLNSPNDVVVHPDGGIWFTDPIFGIRGNYEGFRAESELDMAVYRVDGNTLQIEKVTDEVDVPNGLCFSPDYRKLYVADMGAVVGAGDSHEIKVFDVNGKSLRNRNRFVQLTVPGSGEPAFADGIRCDADGNIWAGGFPAPVIQVIASDGDPIGMIRMPEICANVCFGGPRRNRLFMAGSQSLYSVYVETVGAHIA